MYVCVQTLGDSIEQVADNNHRGRSKIGSRSSTHSKFGVNSKHLEEAYANVSSAKREQRLVSLSPLRTAHILSSNPNAREKAHSLSPHANVRKQNHAAITENWWDKKATVVRLRYLLQIAFL